MNIETKKINDMVKARKQKNIVYEKPNIKYASIIVN